MSAAAEDRPASRPAGFGPVAGLAAVLVILGLLVMLVVSTFSEDDKDRLRRLQTDIREIDGAIRLYRQDFDGRLPEHLSELAGRNDEQKQYLRRIELPKDPWGNDYRLARDDQGNPLVVSDGPDEIPDTDDDITSWNLRSRRR